MIDLHCHSTASDGSLAPAEVVARAAARGVRVLALTDHDTTDGLAEAAAAGEAAGVAVRTGVELSVRAPQGTLHLLGYFPGDAPEAFTDRLHGLAESRRGRAARIVARLAELGYPVDLGEVLGSASTSIGRPHIADALVRAGHVRSRTEAFDRLLHDRGPAYVGYDRLTPEQAIRMVRDGGGAPVLAHPGSLGLPARHLDAYVQGLAAAGLVGIEVHRPEHTGEERRRYGRLARVHGLVPSGGSDFHRPGDGVEPGDTGDPALPADTLDRLLERAAAG